MLDRDETLHQKHEKLEAHKKPVRGVVFDLDGTLADSALDFDAMRAEMGLPAGKPILETLATLPAGDADRCQKILDRHEWAGAERAVAMRGVHAFLERLDRHGIRRAVWTRNSRPVALATLARLAIPFDQVIARDDAPAKPDPSAIWGICAAWDLDCRELVVVGDYVFDMEAGRRAGTRTVLYTAGQAPHTCAGFDLADFHLSCFSQTEDFWRWPGC